MDTLLKNRKITPVFCMDTVVPCRSSYDLTFGAATSKHEYGTSPTILAILSIMKDESWHSAQEIGNQMSMNAESIQRRINQIKTKFSDKITVYRSTEGQPPVRYRIKIK